MKLARLALGAALALPLGAVAQAEETKQPVAADAARAIALTPEQLDRITAAGPFGFLLFNIGSFGPAISLGFRNLDLLFQDETGLSLGSLFGGGS